MDAAMDEIKDKARMKTLNPVEMKKGMKEICRQEAEEQEEVLVKIVTQMKDFVKELDRNITKMPDATAKWAEDAFQMIQNLEEMKPMVDYFGHRVERGERGDGAELCSGKLSDKRSKTGGECGFYRILGAVER